MQNLMPPNLILSTISLVEFEILFSKIIDEKIFQSKTSTISKPQPSEQFATRKDVAKALHISMPNLNQLTKSGIIKAYRLGGRVLYKWEEIGQALILIQTKKGKH